LPGSLRREQTLSVKLAKKAKRFAATSGKGRKISADHACCAVATGLTEHHHTSQCHADNPILSFCSRIFHSRWHAIGFWILPDRIAFGLRGRRGLNGKLPKPGIVGAVCSDASSRRLLTSQIRRSTVQKGTVKWFNPTKGYGFIRPSTGDKDVFVHISAVERAGLSSLNEGQTVEYELVSNRGKTSAENLKMA
jgi:CspA family cold shock protein